MIFTSSTFFVFALALAVLFALVRGQTGRELLLLGASYVFYAAWDFRFLALIGGYTLLGWIGGLLISRKHPPQRSLFLTGVFVAISLSGLFFFKYAELLHTTIFSFLGDQNIKPLGIVLPIAISFTTFEVISYIVDVYRGTVAPTHSLRKYALFMAFFPRLVAGPIIRPAQFLPQIESPIIFCRRI